MLTNDVCAEGEGISYKDLAMYTVPAKVPIKAKDLIATFEKGEVSPNSDQPTTNGEAVITTNGDPTSPGATVRIRMSREVSLDELAEPGTARRLLKEFETRVQQAVAAGVEPPILRNPNSKAAAHFRNSRSSVASDDQSQADQTPASDASPAVEIVPHSISEAPEAHCNGETDAADASEPVDVPSPTPAPLAAATAEEEIAAVVEPAVVEAAQVVETAAVEVEAAANSTSNAVDAQGQDEIPPADVAVHSVTTDVESAPEDTSVEVVEATAKTVLVVSAVREKTPLTDSLLQLFHNSQHKLLLSDVNSSTIVSEEERQKIDAADLVVVHFQPVFNCVPASLQGWFETVFGSGYKLGSIKNCVVLLTTPQQQEDFAGALGDVSDYLRPLQNGLLRQVGFNVLQPQVIFNETSTDLNDVISQWSARLDNIWNEQPVISP